MNLKYIDLYFEIIGENEKNTLCKEYFYYLKEEIECYKSLDIKERQKYFKSIKYNKKYVEELDKNFDCSYIPTAYNIYLDSYNVYMFINEMDKCNSKNIDKIIDKFMNTPLSVHNRREMIIKYSLIKKFENQHDKEVSKLVKEEKYLEGYLIHFKKYKNVEYSFDYSDYYEKYGTQVFKEIIDGLKNNKLYEIINENLYLTDYIVNFCFKYTNDNKHLRGMYSDLKKAIVTIHDNVLINKSISIDENIQTSIDLSYMFINDEELILKLVNGNYKSIKDFCEKEKITTAYFNRFITYLKNYKPELYNSYALVRDDMVRSRYIYLVSYCKNILQLINNGIKANENEVREFDNLDYVLNCNIDINTFRRIVESSPELKNMKNNSNNGCGRYNGFCRKYINRNKTITTIDKLNKQKKVIANYEVTKLDNEEVVNFFISNGIPLEEGLISIALRRKIKGEMDFTNTKVHDSFSELLVDDEYIDVYVDGTIKKYVKK